VHYKKYGIKKSLIPMQSVKKIRKIKIDILFQKLDIIKEYNINRYYKRI